MAGYMVDVWEVIALRSHAIHAVAAIKVLSVAVFISPNRDLQPRSARARWGPRETPDQSKIPGIFFGGNRWCPLVIVIINICYNRLYHLVMTFTVCHRKSIHFLERSTIYFYGPSIPWQTVSHNQRVIT